MCFVKMYEKSDIKVNKLLAFLFLVFIVLLLVVNTIVRKKSSNFSVDIEDTNVYLNEQIQYAKDVYITVSGINVYTTINEFNEEQYILNLFVDIKSEHTKFHILSAKLSNKNFELKSVNLKSKSKMSVFIEALAKETISATINAIGGSVNVIEETLSYIGLYVEGNIENAENKNDFKPIKTTSTIKKFNPCELSETKTIELSFPIQKEYLESENVIVLAIDSASHIEKHIFLTLRPN